MLLILLVILIVFALGSGPWYGYSSNWGYGPSGLLWVIVVVLLVYILMGGGFTHRAL